MRGQSDTSRSTMRGDVEWIIERGERRQHGFQRVDRGAAERRNVQPDAVGEVETEAFHRARVGDDARPLRGRLEARQQVGDVDQLFQRVDDGDGRMAQHRGHHRVVARERAGVSARGDACALAAPRMHQHDRLADFLRACGQCEEFVRLAYLLDEQRRDLRVVVRDQRFEKILCGEVGLVAGRNVERDAETLARGMPCA